MSEGDAFVARVAASLGEKVKEHGEYTRADMKARFQKVSENLKSVKTMK